ncbi:MAG TPA: DUF4124 domain-containing protein [Steroidobacteraceae bacterium]|jgi:hypothetical protein|nr:DUF4124 domain-containing protein [Steroidobacteraceae bacterium]
MRHSITLAVIAGVLTCGFAHAGDVYKYVDERGQTLYTDKPIPGAIRIASTAPRPSSSSTRASQQAASDQQLAASNQRISQNQNDQRVAANVAKDLEASRLERCKKAREDYNTTINSLRLYRTDKEGNRVYLNDAELSQRRIDAAKAVEAICGPQG